MHFCWLGWLLFAVVAAMVGGGSNISCCPCLLLSYNMGYMVRIFIYFIICYCCCCCCGNSWLNFYIKKQKKKQKIFFVFIFVGIPYYPSAADCGLYARMVCMICCLQCLSYRFLKRQQESLLCKMLNLYWKCQRLTEFFR